MTNTSVNPPTAKPVKKKGPLRLEAIIPVSIIFALIFAYFHFFFDSHLKAGAEYFGTQIHGAEINIADIRTSFINARFELDGLQVTDPEKPQRNLFEIGAIRFQMLWDALFRAKVVIPEASILDIKVLSPRKTPGKVIPPKPKAEGGSALTEVQNEALQMAQKQYDKNFLGDVATILGGKDPKEQLNDIVNSLNTDGKVKEIEAAFKEKQKKWEAKVKELPQAKDFENYKARIKALKFDTKNPTELAKNIQEAAKIGKEIDEKVKEIDRSSKELKSDFGSSQQAIKDLEKMVMGDLKDMQNRFKLPDLQPQAIAKNIFMGMIDKKVAGAAKYIELARHNLPQKKKEDNPIVPRKRGTGKTYQFPVTTGYPLLWLKKSSISSALGASEYSGNLKGELTNLTTDPKFVKIPTKLTVAGDFPKMQIFGFSLLGIMDHTTDTPRETLNVSVASFPLTETSLISSPEASLGLNSAKGQSDLNFVYEGNQFEMILKSKFTDLNYAVEAKSSLLKEILNTTMQRIGMIDLNAKVKGTLTQFDIGVNSNLGEALANSFKATVQAKIDDAKKQLQNMINEKIGGEKARLQKELTQAEGGLLGDISNRQKEAADAQKSATESGKDGKNPAKQLEQEGKKLLKKFGF